jgi:hypothetical protein
MHLQFEWEIHLQFEGEMYLKNGGGWCHANLGGAGFMIRYASPKYVRFFKRVFFDSGELDQPASKNRIQLVLNCGADCHGNLMWVADVFLSEI